ncbi:SpaH/EbpB family LPXTG-anchored major pilin [Pseudobutyrivibrio sp.]|uniref:SpaH/EbpB family LPXTG-anchored major pilin n=1 Tax=Pseudobutyrivibrio sp. TaxID=2014367 RepID=UPI001B587C1A|nr:SpaH/EbpB family LPXTG-anchored major pilin [Pseudobutyrivibrio sp.]MBP3262030.1 SpaH/EbpB family LPXTG-anchored major pilin [Pseudobutyrivibrio sp.]
MKKAKKILTLMLAVIMMLSMTIISSAEETSKSATITVTGAEGATLTYAQVIKPDTTTRTGWAIVPEYSALFADFGDDEQSQIEGYLATEAESERIEKLGSVSTSDVFTNPMTVHEAGLYIINAEEEGYDYSPMLAYIGFDDQNALVNTTLKAKKTPKTVGKTVDETTDKFVQVGDEVTYTLTATVPYQAEGATATLVINDELTGGKYKVDADGKTAVTLKVGDDVKPALAIKPEDNKLTIDLTSLITEDNDNANKKVTLTYVAIVTGTTINNKASINNNPVPTTVTSYTGKLKITKMNEVGSNSPKALAGAGFVVVNAEGKYAKLTNNVLTEWVDAVDNATTITTGSDGTATVEGFDADKTYKFHEVVAPEGYKLSDDVTAVWVEGKADAEQIAEATMHDSKLSRLPFTGGSGTALFTIFGVILMSGAAGLYFVSKKSKSSK